MTLHNLKNYKKDYAVCLSISAPLRRGITYTAKKVTLIVLVQNSPCNNFDGGHKAITYFVLKHINIMRIHKQISMQYQLLNFVTFLQTFWLMQYYSIKTFIISFFFLIFFFEKKIKASLTHAFITDFFEALETEEGSQT